MQEEWGVISKQASLGFMDTIQIKKAIKFFVFNFHYIVNTANITKLYITTNAFLSYGNVSVPASTLNKMHSRVHQCDFR